MTNKELYENALRKHNNSFCGGTTLSVASKENTYRDSAANLRALYASYAEEMKQKGQPIPIWF